MFTQDKSIHKEQSDSTKWYDKPFEQVAEVWLSDCRSHLSALTCDKYEFWCRRYVVPRLRGIKVCDITQKTIEDLSNTIFENEKKTGNVLKQTTLSQIGTIVGGVLKFAERQDNPEKKRRTSNRLMMTEPISIYEQERLCICAKNNQCSEMLAAMLALYCGLGIGEVCALHCRDIDLERGTIYVHQTVQRVQIKENHSESVRKTERRVIELPTKKQHRTVNIPEVLITYIEDFYKEGCFLLSGTYDVPYQERTLQNRMEKLLSVYKLDINFMKLHSTVVKEKVDREVLFNVFNGAYSFKPYGEILDVDWLKAEMAVDLKSLRMLLGIALEDVSSYMGISQEEYGKLEAGDEYLSWDQFLALLFFFQYNRKTEGILKPLGLFPSALEQKLLLGSG